MFYLGKVCWFYQYFSQITVFKTNNEFFSVLFCTEKSEAWNPFSHLNKYNKTIFSPQWQGKMRWEAIAFHGPTDCWISLHRAWLVYMHANKYLTLFLSSWQVCRATVNNVSASPSQGTEQCTVYCPVTSYFIEPNSLQGRMVTNNICCQDTVHPLRRCM